MFLRLGISPPPPPAPLLHLPPIAEKRSLGVCSVLYLAVTLSPSFLLCFVQNYSPLNLSFGFSPTQYAAFKEAVHIDHDSMTGFITSMEEKYDLVVFNRSNAFFAISGLVRDDVINCTTELFGLGRQRSG